MQRWEYTPKLFCFWCRMRVPCLSRELAGEPWFAPARSTKCDFLEEAHQGRHVVKYSLSTKQASCGCVPHMCMMRRHLFFSTQGWEISETMHAYYKMLMSTDICGAPAPDEQGAAWRLLTASPVPLSEAVKASDITASPRLRQDSMSTVAYEVLARLPVVAGGTTHTE